MIQGKTTPLYGQHKSLGAKISEFGGFLMPIQYEGAIAEHMWCRQQAAIFDTSHMGQFLVEGNDVESELNRIVTVNVKDICQYRCKYSLMLNEKAGIKDDLIIYKINSDKFMVVVNSATCDSDRIHIEENLDTSKLTVLSKYYGKIDVQGPLSTPVLKDNFDVDLTGLKYYEFGHFDICGEDCIISCTGYTGERGYELYIPNSVIGEVWDKLISHDSVKPAGLAARDTLRLEAGLPLYGQDITEDTIPSEAGLGKYVDMETEFIGKDALKSKSNHTDRRLMFFKSMSRQSPRHGYQIYGDDTAIGIVTSGTFSPCLQCGIGAGYINKPGIKAGHTIKVTNNGRQIECVVVDKPFYRSGHRL